MLVVNRTVLICSVSAVEGRDYFQQKAIVNKKKTRSSTIKALGKRDIVEPDEDYYPDKAINFFVRRDGA